MKQKTKISPKRGKNNRSRGQKKYSPHYLAIVLAVVLILEGALFNITSTADWQKASTILDMSIAVAQTSQDLIATFEPMIEVAQGVNQFYQLAATQMMELLDLSDSRFGSEVTLVYMGVANFYWQAASQMEGLLDESSIASWPATVAGVSISR